jgi:hypothetical protein
VLLLGGRYILESVVIAHKIVHTIYQSKEPRIGLKLYYENDYDRVNLDFLVEMLSGSVSILANGEESSTFKTSKGLRQGDPLSPLLFNLVANVLTRMLDKA